MIIIQFGHSGSFNYGDELGHYLTRQLFRKVFPTACFYMLGVNKEILLREHSDADGIYTFCEMRKNLDIIKNCDLIIYGPGTVMPFSVIPMINTYYELNKKILVWGSGLWSDLKKEHIPMLKNILGITTRTTYGYDIISKYRNDVKIIGDPMLYNIITEQPKPNDVKMNGITISSYIMKMKDSVKINVFKTLKAVMEEIGGQWVAIPASFGENNKNDNDNKGHKILKQYYPNLQILDPVNFKEVTDSFKSLKLYISSRLHTGVVAAGSRIPTVFFGTWKIKRMCEHWKHPELFGGLINMLDKNKLIESIHYANNIFPGIHNDYSSNKLGIKHIISSLKNDIDIIKSMHIQNT